MCLFSSCKKEEDLSPTLIPIPPIVEKGNINFGNLGVGQKSRYVRIWSDFSNSIHPYTDNYEYLEDTLIVEIVSKTDSRFVFQEYLSSLSKSIQDPTYLGYSSHLVDKRTYHVKLWFHRIRTSKLPNKTYRSFVGYIQSGEGGLPLSNFGTNEVGFEGWKVNPSCTCNKNAHINNYKLFGSTYDRLNVLIRNEWMSADGGGSTRVYSKSSGMVRYQTYSIGWMD